MPDNRKHADHYHVLTGIPGCLPGSNYLCETLREAQITAYAEAEAFREAGYARDWGSESQGRVVGNMRDGYEVRRLTWRMTGDWKPSAEWHVWQTITISLCDDADCRCSVCGMLVDSGDGLCPDYCTIDRDYCP